MTINIPPMNTYQTICCILQISISLFLFAILIYYIRKKAAKNKQNEALIFKPNHPSPPPNLSLLEIAELEGIFDFASTRVAGLVELAVNKHISIFHTNAEWKVLVKDLNISQDEIEILKFFLLNNSTENLIVNQYYPLKERAYNNNLAFYEPQIIKRAGQKGLYEAWQYKTTEKLGITIHSYSAPGQPVRMKLGLSIFIVNSIFMIASRAPLSFLICIVSLLTLVLISKTWDKYITVTNYGIQMRSYISGFKDYLKTVEAPKIQSFAKIVDDSSSSTTGELVFQSDMLPYIILFNIDKSWTKYLGPFASRDSSAD